VKRPFSHSSLSSFEQCPAKYKFYYLEGIEKPHESVESFLGRRVHESLEFLYREVGDGKMLLFDHINDHFRNSWEMEWHEHIVIVDPKLKPRDYFQIGEQCLAWYFRTYRPFRESVEGIEMEIVFKLADDDEFEMKGIIDRLDRKDGKLEIHDYKTSKRAMTQAAAGKNRQLALYQIGVQNLYDDVKEVDLVWHFVRTGDTVRSRKSPQQIDELKTSIRGLVHKIEERVAKGGPFLPRPMPLCNWCYYWEECPAKRGQNPFVKAGATT